MSDYPLECYFNGRAHVNDITGLEMILAYTKNT